VDVVSDGQQAVDAALANHYDLIVMDVQMPMLDGCAATRLLRRRGCATPVLAVTAHATPEDRAACLASGCDDYLTKPVNRAAFIQVSRRLSQRRKAA
jgi:CheY-like chemotaxis protein